eukprot:Plantae.Rhodophyta-Purpureofilum_apyrenoidigerum.ctg2978.p1 GENE.Plantae.Rhodophyta-Purpureofilum_apyrenoidigerum.ctg2978~~Plantae.Rhodophyta-Purpureofilum_apyrenoidigerum.ctg2978.p1  ORF type:complete len:371 (+),score=38.03 Plantae.Rhodophyta-Purpureofilum_apyrenoidigerum.ctg2978:390-1502(+)
MQNITMVKPTRISSSCFRTKLLLIIFLGWYAYQFTRLAGRKTHSALSTVTPITESLHKLQKVANLEESKESQLPTDARNSTAGTSKITATELRATKTSLEQNSSSGKQENALAPPKEEYEERSSATAQSEAIEATGAAAAPAQQIAVNFSDTASLLGVNQPSTHSSTASPPGASGTGLISTGTSVSGTFVPGTSTPGTSAPGISAPGTSVPGISEPGISEPRISVPEISVPETYVHGNFGSGISAPEALPPMPEKPLIATPNSSPGMNEAQGFSANVPGDHLAAQNGMIRGVEPASELQSSDSQPNIDSNFLSVATDSTTVNTDPTQSMHEASNGAQSTSSLTAQRENVFQAGLPFNSAGTLPTTTDEVS